MLSRKADGPLEVQIPRPADDQPSWTRVGVIAAIGFIVGVGWPKLAGVRLGPSLPADATSATASAAPPGAPGNEPPSAAPTQGVAAAIATPSTAIAGSAPAPAPAPVAAMPSVTVAHGVVFACKTSDGDSLKGGDCGTLPGLDGVVMPRLRKLAECAEAAGETGKLHLVVHLDFSRGGVGVELGRGQGVSSADALLACAKSDVAGASLSGITHDNPRYSVAYSVTFGAGSGAPAGGAESTPAAPPSTPVATGAVDGDAQVVWEVALIRDAPKTGKIVARLQRGTQIHVGAVHDGWYPVKYGDGFSSDGWVFRGAIGR
ncbi:MAG TPA: SH3 domain-containing protein [Polyangiaceae bacterium]